MRTTSVILISYAVILAAASAHAQSATPIEGNPGTARPAPAAPSTAGAAPTASAPIASQSGSRAPDGNPDRTPASTRDHEPPSR
jgi:hypothetical protein